MDLGWLLDLFFLSFCIHIERKRKWGPGTRWECGRERILGRLHTVSADPYAGLELKNDQIMTWAKVKDVWPTETPRCPRVPFKIHLDVSSAYFRFHFLSCPQCLMPLTLYIETLYSYTDSTYVGHTELLFIHKHLLLIYAHTVSSTCNSRLHLVNSTRPFSLASSYVTKWSGKPSSEAPGRVLYFPVMPSLFQYKCICVYHSELK